ncbi:hypothetical protein [Streptomyces sp. t39]|uniref:hypothetical protein n=1 Tax=Streptomyces sp. t39 TaxID=1828156 RepID=UPI0012CA3DB4|nr:hypothetical protein [Streptomyces sp. t39]TXS57193.1 hypothetical protein EAO77_14695 [Streptomyces sp. t39]
MMSDEKQPNPGTQPAPGTEKPLTPEQHVQEQAEQQEQIEGQFAATDMLERLPDFLNFFGSSTGSVFGSTVFDGRKLNEMLDFLESANPEQLEGAGEALNKANTDINRAAEDLAKFVADVKWTGQGAEEFRRYGAEVVSYAWAIAKMANAAGAQMKVASTGLASVRNARPPRDDRAVQKDAKDFAVPEQTADNPEYQKALQVEKNRQEAINQMNRLASFYAVSESTLARQELPKPPQAYQAAVPLPTSRITAGEMGSGEATSRQPTGSFASAGETGQGEAVQRTGTPGKVDAVTDTSMTIDSTTTAPPPTTTGPTQSQPVVTTTNPTTGPVAGPPITSFGPPRRSTGPITANGKTFKSVGREGVPGPSQQTGRSAQGYGRPMTPTTTGPTSNATGRSQSPMVGRPGGPGMPAGGGQNRQTSATGRSQSPMVGRPGGPGVPGAGRQNPATGRNQPPIVGRPVSGPSSATGRTAPASPAAGRGTGIVGGTPQRTTGQSAGSRLPRGTVVGADSQNTGRPVAGRPSQAGVVGANAQNRPVRQTGRGTPSANGVVGTPRAAGARPDAAGARGDDQRSEHPIDDEETRTNHRRGPVPPVIG